MSTGSCRQKCSELRTICVVEMRTFVRHRRGNWKAAVMLCLPSFVPFTPCQQSSHLYGGYDSGTGINHCMRLEEYLYLLYRESGNQRRELRAEKGFGLLNKMGAS